MPDTDTKQGNKLSMVRGVLEAIIVASLLWTGSTLVAVRVDNATMKEQLSTVVTNTADFPAYKIKTAELSLEINQLKDDVKDLKAVRNMR
jgi:cell division protein FtsB